MKGEPLESMNNPPMLRYIHESNLIENVNDPYEDTQSMLAWEYLSEQPALTHEVICATQYLIVKNQTDLLSTQKGFYRSLSRLNVWVGGRLAPAWTMIEGLMDNWLLDHAEANTRDAILEAHVAFEHRHPFSDGNGRTGRMVMWWQEIKAGLKPTLWLASEKHEKYYPLFQQKKDQP